MSWLVCRAIGYGICLKIYLISIRWTKKQSVSNTSLYQKQSAALYVVNPSYWNYEMSDEAMPALLAWIQTAELPVPWLECGLFPYQYQYTTAGTLK
jgi:hypothetical protein